MPAPLPKPPLPTPPVAAPIAKPPVIPKGVSAGKLPPLAPNGPTGPGFTPLPPPARPSFLPQNAPPVNVPPYRGPGAPGAQDLSPQQFRRHIESQYGSDANLLESPVPALRSEIGGADATPSIPAAFFDGLFKGPVPAAAKQVLQSQPVKNVASQWLSFGRNVAQAGTGGVAAIGAPVLSVAGYLPAWALTGREGRNAYMSTLEQLRQAGVDDANQGLRGMLGLNLLDSDSPHQPSHLFPALQENIDKMREQLPNSWLPAVAQFAADTGEFAGNLAADVANVGLPARLSGPLATAKLRDVPQAFVNGFRGQNAATKLLNGVDAASTANIGPASLIGDAEPVAAANRVRPASFSSPSQPSAPPPQMTPPASAGPVPENPGGTAAAVPPVKPVQDAVANGTLPKVLSDVQTGAGPAVDAGKAQIVKEQGGTLAQASQIWDNLSTPEKVLLGLGVGLTTISMLGGAEGAGKWLTALLGLLMGGGALAHNGVFGDQAQDIVKGLTGNIGGATPVAKQPVAGQDLAKLTELLPHAKNLPAPALDLLWKGVPQDMQKQLIQGANITGNDGPMSYIPDDIAYNRAARYGISPQTAKQLFDIVRQIQARQAPAAAGP